MCEQRLGHPEGLVCTRTDPHEVGHTYQSSAGSELGEGSQHAKEPVDD